MSQIPETNPELATNGPLPDGWTTEYSPQWNAWFYVDTKAANPQAVWTHPLDKNANPSSPSPAYTAEPHAGHSSTSAAPADQPTDPDTRPLPPGWISQYNPDHNTFFYVNEAATDPGSTVTWTHPADAHPPATDLKSPATAATQAGAGAAVTAPGPTGESTKAASTDPAGAPPNLPAGWKAEFDTKYKAWYYINTNDPSAGPTWTLPAGVHSAVPPVGHQAGPTPPITAQSSYTGTSPKKTTDHLPSTATSTVPGGTIPNPANENPDKRPLPPGWITKFDENYKIWYYVDTTKPGNVASWEHPAEKTNTSGAPAAGGTAAPGAYNAGGAPSSNQQYSEQASQAAGGGGLEGLIGGSAGKMVSGLFGSKGRAQMDTFANKLSPEVNKLKGRFSGGSSSGQGQGHSGAPPAGAPGQYGAPPAQGQYGAPTTAPGGRPGTASGPHPASYTPRMTTAEMAGAGVQSSPGAMQRNPSTNMGLQQQQQLQAQQTHLSQPGGPPPQSVGPGGPGGSMDHSSLFRPTPAQMVIERNVRIYGSSQNQGPMEGVRYAMMGPTPGQVTQQRQMMNPPQPGPLQPQHTGGSISSQTGSLAPQHTRGVRPLAPQHTGGSIQDAAMNGPGGPATAPGGRTSVPSTPQVGSRQGSMSMPPPGQGQYGAPPTPGQAPYGSPPSGQGQYGAPPTTGQAPYGSPPPPGQGQYGPPGAHNPVPGQGPPAGQPGQYNPAVSPPPGGGYGAPPPGQAPPGQGGPGGLNSLAEKFGKFGLGKK